MFTADAGLELRSFRASVGDGHPNELADSGRVERLERVVGEDPALDVPRQEAAGISSFEFCYDKPQDEHVLRWREGEGFRHARVDDGEDNPARNRTPIHVADGEFDLGRLAARFRQLGSDIDPEIYRFVLARLNAGG